MLPEDPYMGGCQHYGPFLDPYYNAAPNFEGTQKGAKILTTTHIILWYLPSRSTLQSPHENKPRWEFPELRRTLFWGPYNKDPTI